MNELTQEIIKLWSEFNPVMAYTSDYTTELTSLFFETAEASMEMRKKIVTLEGKLSSIADEQLRATAKAILISLETQLDMTRPSGAGPSGTGMGGVYAAADGVFYIVLKKDYKAAFVGNYLDTVQRMVEFETQKWTGQDFTILVRRECLDTAVYMTGTLSSLKNLRPDLQAKITAILAALKNYQSLFNVEGLESPDFATCWKIFKEWDSIYGPNCVYGYPGSLQNYYQLPQTKEEIETIALGWLELELPITIDIAQRIKNFPFITYQESLQEIWDAVSKKYSVDFGKYMTKVVNIDHGKQYQYWAAAQNLLYKDELDDIESAYLALYGDDRKSQVEGVLCAQLETYIWRVIRYIRALCDTKVNGGEMTYTDFIEWAAEKTGLSAATLHGECFTFLASPGYAPCYAMGGATYAMIQKEGLMNKVTEISFNTFCSRQGFYAWPVAIQLMNKYIA
jgi:hypothetical protein